MNNQHFQQVTHIFHMLSQPHRLKIMWLCLKQPLSVSDITIEMKNLSQSLVSHHLKQLREANLIHSARNGKHVLYQVTDEWVRCIICDMFAHTKRRIKRK